MVASLPVFPFEPDLPFLRLRLRHQAADGVEDNPEICVVSALQFLQLSRQVLIGGQYLPKPDKGPHNLDVYIYSPVTVKNAGKHGNPLLGEYMGKILAVLSTSSL